MRSQILICILVNIVYTNCARILGVFPVPISSHKILTTILVKELSRVGHDLTVITPFKEKSPPNWREIHLDDFQDLLNQGLNINQKEIQKSSGSMSPSSIVAVGLGYTEKTLGHPKVRNLLNSGEKFDVVIMTQFANEALYALAQHFQAHLVLLSTIGPNPLNNNLVGNPVLPSFYPDILLNVPTRMTFAQRARSMLHKILAFVYIQYYLYPKHDELIKRYISQNTDLSDVLNNVSLVLLNSHTSITQATPKVPNMVEIGGFHIPETKKLPDDMQKFLDKADEGVIYFSLGSNVKSKDLGESTKQAILKAFSKRKEKILWKYEENLPEKPTNVYINKWFPQNDVLAHPQIKLFITHGGLLSTTEAIYHGVPIIAIPFFGDQPRNAQDAKAAGYAIVLNIRNLTEEELSESIEEITSNPQYKYNIKNRSKILRDRKVKPLDEAVYWIEYIVRHNGANHLRVPYLHLTWYQYYSLDVFGLVFVAITIFTVVMVKICKYLWSRNYTQKIKLN